MDPAQLLEQRRQGITWSASDIGILFGGTDSSESIAGAALMALATLEPSEDEIHELTAAYVGSGRTVKWADPSLVCDKHSTGAVGDNVSIVLGPTLAAVGLKFAKLSGRALRHCGGTIDKLACIPGISLSLDHEMFRRCVGRHGFCIASQSPDLVPMDARTYQLRQLTGTVEVPALIAASVMSKKLACGAGLIALDVFHGRGALIDTQANAEAIGALMCRIGELAGRRMLLSVSESSAPLAPAAGPMLELREALGVLQGGGSKNLRSHVRELASRVICATESLMSPEQAALRVDEVLDNGTAFEIFSSYVSELGGDARWLTRSGLRRTLSTNVVDVPSGQSGIFVGLDMRQLGQIAQWLSALEGPTSGVRLLVEPGDECESTQAVLQVHCEDRRLGEEVSGRLGRAIKHRQRDGSR